MNLIKLNPKKEYVMLIPRSRDGYDEKFFSKQFRVKIVHIIQHDHFTSMDFIELPNKTGRQNK